jgi:hypothetical protein
MNNRRLALPIAIPATSPSFMSDTAGNSELRSESTIATEFVSGL